MEKSLEKELSRSDHSAHGHRGSLSNASTISVQDNSRGSPNSENNENSLLEVQQKVDVNLVLKLQRMLDAVQLERDELFKQIDLSEKSQIESKYKIQELEIENEKLHVNIEKLSKTIETAINSNDDGANELMNQFHELKTELARRRCECSQLRSELLDNPEGFENIAVVWKGINEDGKIIFSFEIQKKNNRQLEAELQWKKSQWDRERNMLKEDILRLKQDNDRKEALLSSNLTKSQTQCEIYLQSEIARVATENLHIREKCEMLQKVCRNYRKIKINIEKRLSLIVEEYEKKFSQMSTRREKEKKEYEANLKNLEEEKESALQQLNNLKIAFNDIHQIHQEYERGKIVIEALKRSLSDYEQTVKAVEKKYEVDSPIAEVTSEIEKKENELSISPSEFKGI